MELQPLLDELRTQLGIQTDLTQVMLAFALLMSRVLPVVILTPFLGGESVPSEVKLGLGVMLGLVLYPLLIAQTREIPVGPLVFIALMLKELFIGLSLAMVVNIIFDAANVAGGFIDVFSGTNQAQLMVPQIGSQVSLFANLNLQLTTVLFLTLGGHHLVIGAFADSLELVRLDQIPRFGQGFWPFFDAIIRTSADMLRIAVAISSPVLLATFLTDLALGMINRVAPQVQVFFVAMQLKPAVSVLIMLTATHLILNRAVSEFSVMFGWLRRVIVLLS
ncbi:MAG: flagellar biosynthetic protein FliR [Myxococcaceae bacterium]|jgi:flagellar biosynthetic protein FliR|nr:flagellar biosynthetic protein FliR [Myxococcaceae bacterium]